MADDEAAAVAAGATTAADISTDAGASTTAPLDNDEALEALFDEISAKPDDEPTVGAAEAVKTPVGTQNAGQSQTEGGEPGAGQAITVPTSWPAEMKDKWSSVPPEVQQYVAGREAEVHREFTRMGEEVARFRPVGELIETRIAAFDRNGIPPVDGINLMLDMQELLEQNPVAGLSAIAQSFGIDLAATFGGKQDGQQQQQSQDPQVAALATRLRQTEQRLQERDSQDRRESERQQNARRTEAVTEVQKWSADKPHFGRPEIKKAMSALYANGLATSLDHAYEQACNAIPEVRALLKADADKASLVEQARVVADAKRAIPSRIGTRTGVPVKAGRWDADDNLEAAYDSIAAA